MKHFTHPAFEIAYPTIRIDSR